MEIREEKNTDEYRLINLDEHSFINYTKTKHYIVLLSYGQLLYYQKEFIPDADIIEKDI